MKNFFLKAKHWQLFLLMFGVPMAFYIAMIYAMMSTVFSSIQANGGAPDDAVIMTSFFGYMKFLPLIVIVFMGSLYAWYWSVVVGLQSRLPEGVTMNLRLFKIFFFFPILYIIAFLLVISFFIEGIIYGDGMENFGMLSSIMFVVFPLHLFSMFCTFYAMYFVARTIKTVELQRQTTFGDFAGEFFLIWFYPIGIWILQPKINRLATGNNNSTTGYSGTEDATILDGQV